MVNALKASGHRPGTLTHVHNGIDLNRVRATGSVAADERSDRLERREHVVIGTAGRLSPVKGHEHLVRRGGANRSA